VDRAAAAASARFLSSEGSGDRQTTAMACMLLPAKNGQIE